MTSFEQEYWKLNELVCGIDEVGRGPIAGPLVVCGVILPKNYFDDRINDSKTLSFKRRLTIFDVILENAISIEVEVINEKTIDQENIYQATKLAMQTIADRCKADYCLIDAMKLESKKTCVSIIKGDSKSISIAAASIVAKVIRDQIMLNFDSVYPEYDFKNNKGYPTKKHKQALVDNGYIQIHRKSFNPIKSML
ncbi:MAG: ribonuclease HII [Erysipelothrix sp.]|nr:ribonuclease HII [Erysipelothrix sp.]